MFLLAYAWMAFLTGPATRSRSAIALSRHSAVGLSERLPPIQPIDRLRAAVVAREYKQTKLNEADLPIIADYLNDHVAEEMLQWVMKLTDVGKTASKKNAWSNGSWKPRECALTKIVLGPAPHMLLTVSVEERGKNERTSVSTTIRLPPSPYGYLLVDDLRSALLKLSFDSGDPLSNTRRQLLQLPGSSDTWSLPDDLWLNSTPYTRECRHLFYPEVKHAMQAAVANADGPRLFKVPSPAHASQLLPVVLRQLPMHRVLNEPFDLCCRAFALQVTVSPPELNSALCVGVKL